MFIAVLLAAGIGCVLYPLISNIVSARHQSHAVETYIESVEELDEEDYTELFERAYAYNEWLFESGRLLALTEEELEEYMTQLSVESTDVMAYIRIEKIDVYLPIYHTTDDAVLQVGVGHLEGTSLPVGGESTHCVLAAHTGLPTSTLFSDLDELEIGDTFQIFILGQTLTYEVDRILTVDPYDIEDVAIVEGEDYVTLLTCTPYGVNSHRLLVRGHRTENPAAEETQEDEQDSLLLLVIAILLILLLLMLSLEAGYECRKRRRLLMRNS